MSSSDFSYVTLIGDMRQAIDALLDPLTLLFFRIARGLSEEWARRYVWNALPDGTRALQVMHPDVGVAALRWLHAHRFHVDARLAIDTATRRGRVDLLAYYHDQGLLERLCESARVASPSDEMAARLPSKNRDRNPGAWMREHLPKLACMSGQLEAALWLSDTLAVPLEDTWCWDAPNMAFLDWWIVEHGRQPARQRVTLTDFFCGVMREWYHPRSFLCDEAAILARLEWFYAYAPDAFSHNQIIRSRALSSSSALLSLRIVEWCRARFLSGRLLPGDMSTWEMKQVLSQWRRFPELYPTKRVLEYWTAVWEGVDTSQLDEIRAFCVRLSVLDVRDMPRRAELEVLQAFMDARDPALVGARPTELLWA